jgi:hypothetical protein
MDIAVYRNTDARLRSLKADTILLPDRARSLPSVTEEYDHARQ